MSGVREMHDLLVFFLHHKTLAEMQPRDPRAQLAKSLSEEKLAWRTSGTLHGEAPNLCCAVLLGFRVCLLLLHNLTYPN